MASASIRGEDLWTSFSLRRASVAEPSENISFEIGRRPYSKGSRRRWRRKPSSFAAAGDGVDVAIEPSIASVIVFFFFAVAEARERERENGEGDVRKRKWKWKKMKETESERCLI